jgi:hypothetical protein
VITLTDAHDAIAKDWQLQRIAGSEQYDPEYGRYLAVLYKHGLITDEHPLRREETVQREELANQALVESQTDPNQWCA